MAETTDIVIEQKATFVLSIVYNDTNGDPVDLTGYSARMMVKASHDTADVDAVIDIDSDAGGTGDVSGIGLDDSGNISVVVAKAETTGLDPGDYVWDILLEDSDGRATRLIEGKAVVKPGVTK